MRCFKLTRHTCNQGEVLYNCRHCCCTCRHTYAWLGCVNTALSPLQATITDPVMPSPGSASRATDSTPEHTCPSEAQLGPPLRRVPEHSLTSRCRCQTCTCINKAARPFAGRRPAAWAEAPYRSLATTARLLLTLASPDLCHSTSAADPDMPEPPRPAHDSGQPTDCCVTVRRMSVSVTMPMGRSSPSTTYSWCSRFTTSFSSTCSAVLTTCWYPAHVYG